MPNPVAIGFNVPFQEAIDFTKKRGVVLPEKYYGELQGIHRTLNYSIAGVASLDQLQGVLDSLEESLKNGNTFKQWQKDIRVQDLGLSKARLDNIYRTNIQTAYNRGRWQQQVENQKAQPYLMYDAINDSRVRPSHLAMDGIIRRVDDPFWDTHYPENGYRCRCRCISLSATQAAQRSKNGTGLNQKITPEMTPDKGWDYNVGEDLTAGIEKAVAERNANERIARQLKAALNEKLVKVQTTPVSDALILPESGIVKDSANYALKTINRIHSVADTLPMITLSGSDSIAAEGIYSPKKSTIKINNQAIAPESTVIHEIGHFMDYQAIGKAGTFASIENELLSDWRNAIDNSQATKILNRIPNKSLSDYYLDRREQFARSYLQYITLKTGDKKLLNGINFYRNNSHIAHKNAHWSDDDFKQIAKEFDALFLILGWNKDD